MRVSPLCESQQSASLPALPRPRDHPLSRAHDHGTLLFPPTTTTLMLLFLQALGMYELPLLQWGVLDLGALLVFILALVVTEYRPVWWSLKRGAGSLPPGSQPPEETKPKKLTVDDVPGPMALPIIGTRWIYYGKYSLNKIHEAYKDMFERYGTVVREEAVWNYPIVNLFDRIDIEKVLRHSSKYPLRPPTDVTAHYRKSRPDRYTNLGIINEQGEAWHRLRSLLTPELMSAKTMQRFLPELNNVADDFNILLLDSRDANGVVIGFDDLACRMGLESTCTLILGRRMGFLEKEFGSTASRLAEAVKDQFCASRDTFFGLPFWKIFPTPAYNKFMKSEDTIYDIISELVDDAVKEEKDTCALDAVQSVFMAILQAPGLDIRDKKAGIIDFIAAGIKTLGNTLVFLLYLIAKNPRCQQKLYEEIISLASPGTPLTSQTLKGAHYLRACMMEAFRILPTAPCVARILETNMEVSGYHLKPGSIVICHTWLACLQEKNFTKALEFEPERWLSDETLTTTSQIENKSPFLVVPFGVGRRMCPGKRFVELELQVVLAQTVRQFEIEFDGDLKLEFEFLLAPESPVNFRFKDRI